MSIGSQGELFSVMASGDLDRVVGTEETDWLDFKKTAYRLDDVRAKWELAKDVSAFANSRGGCIVMGVETRREQHQITDVATAIRPIRKVLVDPQRSRLSITLMMDRSEELRSACPKLGALAPWCRTVRPGPAGGRAEILWLTSR